MGCCGRCIRGTCCSVAIVLLCVVLSPLLKRPRQLGDGDLVLAHIPYNFGHTIEANSILGQNWTYTTGRALRFLVLWKSAKNPIEKSYFPPFLKKWWFQLLAMDGAIFYGIFYPGLDETNEVSGCATYLTPQKHWPEEVAKDYFGKKKVFGMLRDPYERLVAQFRGNIKGYGSDEAISALWEACDVNNGVKTMLKNYQAAKNPFAFNCALLPQAEYFDGPYGITVPIDNRKFPDSFNAAFKENGYAPIFQIESNEVMHVSGCNEQWSGDLDNETRALIRQLFARDFELLCKHFGYCDNDERACLPLVPEMCPAALTQCRNISGKPSTAHLDKGFKAREPAVCNAAWEPGSSGPPPIDVWDSYGSAKSRTKLTWA